MPESAAPGTLTIAARFNGPDGSANGGYACGLLASVCTGPVAVTLHAPPRLDTPLRIERKARRVHLWDATELVASATRARHQLATVPPVRADLAAQGRYPGLDRHPYPRCFACGTERLPGDGLRLAPAPVTGTAGTVACRWVPDEGVLAADDRVRTEVVWPRLLPDRLDRRPAGRADGARLDASGNLRPARGRARLRRCGQARPGRRSGYRRGFRALRREAGVLLAAAATRWYGP